MGVIGHHKLDTITPSLPELLPGMGISVKGIVSVCDQGLYLIALLESMADYETQILFQEVLQVLLAQHASVTDKDHPLQAEAILEIAYHLPDCALVRRGSVKDVVAQGGPIPGHDHADHDLPSVRTMVPAVAITSDVFRDNGVIPFEIARRDVVEHKVQLLVKERQEPVGDLLLDLFLVIDEPVHGPKEVVVLHLISVDTRQIYPFKPLQQSKLARGVADAVDHHKPDVGLQVEGLPGLLGLLLEDGADLELLPDFKEREDMAVIPSALQRNICGGGAADGFADPVDDVVHVAVGDAVDLAEVGDDAGDGVLALLGVAVGLHDLYGAVGAVLLLAGDDADEHSATFTSI